jgi:hypothetical protein
MLFYKKQIILNPGLPHISTALNLTGIIYRYKIW